MTSRPARIASLAVALAALLTVSVLGAAAADTSVSRDQSAEKYARSLLNCTRTGGWVEPDGSCSDRGSGKHSAYRKPLPLHAGLSQKVAWPWARAMVANDLCEHVIAGKPELGQRLANKGFGYHYYGENIGCGGYGAARDDVLAAHLYMQAEKSSGGGHWLNMKNAGYRSVGIGVATRDGITRVVFDFYGKRW